MIFSRVNLIATVTIAIFGLSLAERKYLRNQEVPDARTSSIFTTRAKPARQFSLPQECPAPDEQRRDRCLGLVEPVLCPFNGIECEYSNICEAKITKNIQWNDCTLKVNSILPLQGSSPSETRECPIDMINDIACTEQYEPVICDIDGRPCEYSNNCIANATIGINSLLCVNKDVKVDSLLPLQGSSPSETRECPIDMMNDIFCPEQYEPVICDIEGRSCEYSNNCIANATIGINSLLCVIKDNDSGTANIFGKSPNDLREDVDDCSALTSNFPCTREYVPIKCEYKDSTCFFSNECIARSKIGEENMQKCVAV